MGGRAREWAWLTSVELKLKYRGGEGVWEGGQGRGRGSPGLSCKLTTLDVLVSMCAHLRRGRVTKRRQSGKQGAQG